MPVIYSPKIITNGLVLCLDAANKRSYTGSGTSWKDLSGNGNNGTLINGPTFNSANGGSVVFDGVNDYVNGIENSIINTSYITVCVWNYGEVSKVSSVFWFTDVANGHNRVCQAHIPWTGRVVYFDCGSNGGFTFDRINKTATNNEYLGWHYWVFTKDVTSGIMRIFLDGNLWHSGSGKIMPLRSCDTGMLGVSMTNEFHQGLISSFLVYSKVLSAQEILQNYNATKGRFGL